MLEKATVVILIVIIVASVILAIMSPSIPSQTQTTENGVQYRMFEIEGMPCVYVTEGVSNAKTGGPSCDWSKWRGKK